MPNNKQDSKTSIKTTFSAYAFSENSITIETNGFSTFQIAYAFCKNHITTETNRLTPFPFRLTSSTKHFNIEANHFTSEKNCITFIPIVSTFSTNHFNIERNHFTFAETFGMSLVTLSFLLTTPEVYVPNLGGDFATPHYGFPYLSGAGRLVLKDIIMLAAGLIVASIAAQHPLKETKSVKNKQQYTTPLII